MLVLLVLIFVFLDKCINVIPVYKHLPPDLNIGELTIPDLASPEPFGCTDMGHQLFD